jgi:UDP-N-acetylglucosamine 1-carboxyvinyltransferase
MKKLLIRGQKALKGTVTISGSKNAALPLVGACLLSKEKSVLKNVPDIADIRTLIIILEFLGCEVSFEKEVLTIDPKNLANKEIPHELVSKMRGSIILLAPLLAHFGEVKLSFPGGCVLGKRPIDAHLDAFVALGAEVLESEERICLRVKDQLQGKQFCMTEMSVTATENAIMAAVLAKGSSQIRLCAAEPHVQDLCNALNKAGAKITGVGTHNLNIEGVSSVSGINHSVCADYLEIGTYAIAAAITKGHVTIKNANEEHLDIFWNKMKEMGVKFEHRENEVEIFPSEIYEEFEDEEHNDEKWDSFEDFEQEDFDVFAEDFVDDWYEGYIENIELELEEKGINLNSEEAEIILEEAENFLEEVLPEIEEGIFEDMENTFEEDLFLEEEFYFKNNPEEFLEEIDDYDFNEVEELLENNYYKHEELEEFLENSNEENKGKYN